VSGTEGEMPESLRSFQSEEGDVEEGNMRLEIFIGGEATEGAMERCWDRGILVEKIGMVSCHRGRPRSRYCTCS